MLGIDAFASYVYGGASIHQLTGSGKVMDGKDKTDSTSKASPVVTTNDVESKMIVLRGQLVLIDADVAELYGVETKRVNEAVKNNQKKFPDGYLFVLDKMETKEVVENFDHLKKLMFSAVTPTAFTERGLYMLATILKGDRAISTTLAIIDTFVQVRELARTMEALQGVEDGGKPQQTLLQRTGNILAGIVGQNLSTHNTETEIELNFAVVKIKHKVIRK